MTGRYQKSEEYLARALKTIPLGSQTFSKSKTQLPLRVSPFFADRAKGAYLWDVDGNRYIDFVNSLASVTLGYNDPDVTQAVTEQLKKGTIFSLANELEFKVAEKIVEMVPCADMVRFGKNGSDATAGAIRLARAYTKKDYVIVCGYHGWQDWYIGSTTRDAGVPAVVKELTHKFTYNDIGSLERKLDELKGKVAAVIMEPVNVVAPENDFLQKVKELTHMHGAVLIFDETITGFRYAPGGAQQFFGVIPDLATFGKGLANGYPVSAVAGKADIMQLMEEIFFSFTFGGETLSLAASLATLNKLQQEPVIETMFKTGTLIIDQLNQLIKEFQLSQFFSVSGYPVWSFFIIKETAQYNSWELKSLLLQEMFANGIFTIGTHNVSYAHTEDDVSMLLKAYRVFFIKVADLLTEKSTLKSMLKCEPLKPLFKVR
jgi:glutamate-1-semialdehyde 2,1-aminomutase